MTTGLLTTYTEASPSVCNEKMCIWFQHLRIQSFLIIVEWKNCHFTVHYIVQFFLAFIAPHKCLSFLLFACLIQRWRNVAQHDLGWSSIEFTLSLVLRHYAVLCSWHCYIPFPPHFIIKYSHQFVQKVNIAKRGRCSSSTILMQSFFPTDKHALNAGWLCTTNSTAGESGSHLVGLCQSTSSYSYSISAKPKKEIPLPWLRRKTHCILWLVFLQKNSMLSSHVCSSFGSYDICVPVVCVS